MPVKVALKFSRDDVGGPRSTCSWAGMRWGETVGSSTGNRESFRFGIAAHFFVEGPRGDLTCMPEEVLKSRKAPGSSAVGKGWLGCFGPIFPASTVCLRCVQLRRNYPPRLGISPGRMSANTFAAGGAPRLLPLMVAGQAFPRWKRAAGVMMALDAWGPGPGHLLSTDPSGGTDPPLYQPSSLLPASLPAHRASPGGKRPWRDWPTSFVPYKPL